MGAPAFAPNPARDVLQDQRWNVGWYKDGIHPTAAGFGVLAGMIRDDMDRLERVGM